MKIKNLSLKNFRGVKKEVTISLENSQSLIVYGDNGTGKSSFVDAVEWFVTDNVSHLGGEEIETHGGLRNTLCKDTDESFVSIDFSDGKKNKKVLSFVKEKLKSKFDVTDAIFESVLADLSKERLWLRNAELVAFILKTKKDRLSDVSDIIGYDDVTKTKAVLKKSANDIRTIIKNKNFEGQFATKKGLMAVKLGQVINNREQFYSAIENLVAPYFNNLKITNHSEYLAAFEQLSSDSDKSELEKQESLKFP